MFDSKIIEEEKNLLVKVKGDLDVYAEDQFKDFINDEIKDINKDIILDLAELDYLDSTGLGLFMKIYKLAKDAGKKVKVINPKENIYKLFKITDLREIFYME